MIVAHEKTGYYGLAGQEPPRVKKTYRRRPLPGKHRFWLTGLVLSGFFVGVLLVYYYAQVFTLGNQVHRLEKELAILRVENHSLDGEIQRLASLDRVEYLAINKLGMVKPDSKDVLLVTVAGGSPPEQKLKGEAGQPPEGPVAGEEKSRLIRAFTELVDRLEDKMRLGLGPGANSLEGNYANNNHPDPEKDHRSIYSGRVCASLFDFSPGMASVG